MGDWNAEAGALLSTEVEAAPRGRQAPGAHYIMSVSDITIVLRFSDFIKLIELLRSIAKGEVHEGQQAEATALLTRIKG